MFDFYISLSIWILSKTKNKKHMYDIMSVQFTTPQNFTALMKRTCTCTLTLTLTLTLNLTLNLALTLTLTLTLHTGHEIGSTGVGPCVEMTMTSLAEPKYHASEQMEDIKGPVTLTLTLALTLTLTLTLALTLTLTLTLTPNPNPNPSYYWRQGRHPLKTVHTSRDHCHQFRNNNTVVVEVRTRLLFT